MTSAAGRRAGAGDEGNGGAGGGAANEAPGVETPGGGAAGESTPDGGAPGAGRATPSVRWPGPPGEAASNGDPAMRVKVRAVEPPADEAGLEEIVVAVEAATGVAPGAGPRDPGRTRLRPADLGPNGDVVFDLLLRASRLTAAERRALEKEAAWRWWMMTPLAGTTMPAARARALVLGRGAGRAEAIVALETAVAAIAHHLPGAKAGRSRLPACISNAGLAVLVRDLVEPESFETLFGPWREVMHH